MKRRSFLAGTAGVFLGVGASAARALTADEITEIAREAYLWGYPIVDNYAVLHSYALDPEGPEFKAPVNRISHARTVAGPGDRTIVAPNVDTPYSHAWLDLRAEPIVLTLPTFEAERYVSLQLIDAYTYILGYVTPRTNGNSGGVFLVAGPGWKGEVPDGIDGLFRSPTDLVLAFYRTQMLTPDDLERVHALQDGYRVAPLSEFLGVGAPASLPALDPIDPVDIRRNPDDMQFFKVLNWMLDLIPVLPEERDLRARFEMIGIGPSRGFSPVPATEAAVRGGMMQALGEMRARAGQIKSSAELFGSREFLGQDYLTRAVAAMIGIYGNAAEEFLGVGYQTDSLGRAFNGAHRYTITFPADGLPDVGAFWSITVYDAERFVYANEIDRYSINMSMLPDLARNVDGSITIHLQHGRPDDVLVANWLPIPATPFGLTFRTYLPGPAIREGRWLAPPVIRSGP